MGNVSKADWYERQADQGLSFIFRVVLALFPLAYCAVPVTLALSLWPRRSALLTARSLLALSRRRIFFNVWSGTARFTLLKR